MPGDNGSDIDREEDERRGGQRRRKGQKREQDSVKSAPWGSGGSYLSNEDIARSFYQTQQRLRLMLYECKPGRCSR